MWHVCVAVCVCECVCLASWTWRHKTNGPFLMQYSSSSSDEKERKKRWMLFGQRQVQYFFISFWHVHIAISPENDAVSVIYRTHTQSDTHTHAYIEKLTCQRKLKMAKNVYIAVEINMQSYLRSRSKFTLVILFYQPYVCVTYRYYYR